MISAKCSKCGPRPIEEFYLHRGRPRTKCKLCWSDVNRASYGANRVPRIRAAVERKQRSPEKNQEHNRNSRQRSRMKILRAYGGEKPSCLCCGESELAFLTLDHTEGGGNAHRRKITGTTSGGSKFYAWIIRNSYPPGFRILCHNCNYGMARPGGCPHGRLPLPDI